MGYLVCFVWTILIVTCLIIVFQRWWIYPSWMLDVDQTLLSHPELIQGPDYACLYRPPQKPDGEVIVFFHGSGQTIGTCQLMNWMDERSMEQGVCIVEYADYGILRTNKWNAPKWSSIVESAYRALQAIDLDPQRAIFIGHSLGCSVALDMVGRFGGAVQELYLVAPFLSLNDVVLESCVGPFKRVFKKLVKENIDNRRLAADVSMPGNRIVVVGCLYDKVVPYQHSMQLAQLLDARHVSWHCGHNPANMWCVLSTSYA